MDKSSFLKHFSPEMNKHKEGGPVSSSERDFSNSKNDGLRLGDISAVDNSAINHSSKASAGVATTLIQGNNRIHLKVVDKMMKEKLKMLKLREEAEDQSRRKQQEE